MNFGDGQENGTKQGRSSVVSVAFCQLNSISRLLGISYAMRNLLDVKCIFLDADWDTMPVISSLYLSSFHNRFQTVLVIH